MNSTFALMEVIFFSARVGSAWSPVVRCRLFELFYCIFGPFSLSLLFLPVLVFELSPVFRWPLPRQGRLVDASWVVFVAFFVSQRNECDW